ncbi:MAG TPA: hypothetical protein VH301_05015 [Usitatibacter sp.]|nr:hypothetical protein [Usitatibacter sp.]
MGAAGAALLAASHWLGTAYAAPRERSIYSARASSLVKALAPVVLEGVLPAAEDERVRAIEDIAVGFGVSLAALGSEAQEDFAQLFNFLDFAPTRIAFAGLWRPLDESSPAELREFLQRWRFSRHDVQQAGYQALTQLIQAAWYDLPAAWPRIAYPGPPRLA